MIEDRFQCCALFNKKMKVMYYRRQGISLLDVGTISFSATDLLLGKSASLLYQDFPHRVNKCCTHTNLHVRVDNSAETYKPLSLYGTVFDLETSKMRRPRPELDYALRKKLNR